jgi:hypothetical protein
MRENQFYLRTAGMRKEITLKLKVNCKYKEHLYASDNRVSDENPYDQYYFIF